MATTFASDRLVDWGAARAVGARTAGAGPVLTSIDRARLNEDFGELVPEAHALVESFTGLSVDGYRSRPWVMTRSDWLQANLRGFHGILEPFAAKVLLMPDHRVGFNGLTNTSDHPYDTPTGELRAAPPDEQL